ncbi:molecular chaperone [Pseudomonas syringae]|uniref:fimbrial biogenesis chaperone n=1 Tax=Pseudomonas syringae TaxID=317 RepID=UPI001F243F4F|nr:molecular chaperone [Pseudomonas syringae]MCF5722561.1 fimbria/pilus periplasmic chaperone [Pseudomonas syringae]
MASPPYRAPRYLAIALVLLFVLGEPIAWAGIIITGTRHVYPEARREITIQVTNDDTQAPRLVQAWIDRGEPHSGPESSDVPFSLSPPVFRVEGGMGQAIRLLYTREPLPADRESMFWLNVLEVPPKVSPPDAALDEPAVNYLRFAFRIRTKVFFRPAQLAGSPEEATTQLDWHLRHRANGAQLVVSNPSAYHVTLNEVALAMGPQADAQLLRSESGMVAPGGTLSLSLPHSQALNIPADAQVQFSTINDYGALSTPQRAALRF